MEKIINQAIALFVNDVYVIPKNTDTYNIKYHLDGQTKVFAELSSDEAQILISKIKYRAKMNISERRRPQIGRFDYQNIWIRVSTVSNFLNQETLVLRIIYSNQCQQNWIMPKQIQIIQESLPSSGLVVIAGPTGSGKTTTLYHMLQKLSDSKLILTIEDPVEIQEPNFVQLQVNEEAQMTYDDLIKVALRHRPEVLLIGEIRDKKTAQAAIRAALSGHLVLSTIHAMSARDVVMRLLDLGVDKSQLLLSLNGAVYQRLLPTKKNQQGALIDYLSKEQVNTIFSERNMSKFSDFWHNGLNYGIEHEIISNKTFEKFKNLE